MLQCGSSTCGYLSGFISVRKSKALFLLCYDVSMRLQLFQYMHVPFCYLCRMTFCLFFLSFFWSVPWHLAFYFFLQYSPSIVFFLSNELWKATWRWNVIAHTLAHGCVCIIYCSRKFLYFPLQKHFIHTPQWYFPRFSGLRTPRCPAVACDVKVLCGALLVPVCFYQRGRLG